MGAVSLCVMYQHERLHIGVNRQSHTSNFLQPAELFIVCAIDDTVVVFSFHTLASTLSIFYQGEQMTLLQKAAQSLVQPPSDQWYTNGNQELQDMCVSLCHHQDQSAKGQ